MDTWVGSLKSTILDIQSRASSQTPLDAFKSYYERIHTECESDKRSLAITIIPKLLELMLSHLKSEQTFWELHNVYNP